MKLNRSHIQNAKGEYKYPTESQFKSLGFNGPFLNWETELLGKEFSSEEIHAFVGKYNNRKIKKKSKQKYKPPKKKKTKRNPNKEYDDQRWKDKRKEILTRDKYTCVRCGVKKVLFNIHHLLYIKNKHMWEVPDYYLITLCESCHRTEHSQQYIPPPKHY